MGGDRSLGADHGPAARWHLRVDHGPSDRTCARDVRREPGPSRNCRNGSPRPMASFANPFHQTSGSGCVTPEDRLAAEQKLDQWLVKPTDGVFARMNRKVSIPISRQLIKFPITPNMVSLFTLGVSFSGGRRSSRSGAGQTCWSARMLSVFASILDGCDGEVARLTFQESAFGCWLETVCDYLYYVFIFAGMMIGLLARGPVYMVWGSLLFFGALASFLTTALQRQQDGRRPPRAVSDALARAGVEATLESASVPRPAHGVPDPAMLHALSVPGVRAFRRDIHGFHRRRGGRQHRLADRALFLFHVRPGPDALMLI